MKKLIITALCACSVTGCAVLDRATIYTENGIVLAEQKWDEAYMGAAEICEVTAQTNPSEMEACFGKYYDANGYVEKVVENVVMILRAYWTARAAGESPDWEKTASQVMELIEDIPEPAATYFNNVKGL